MPAPVHGQAHPGHNTQALEGGLAGVGETALKLKPTRFTRLKLTPKRKTWTP